MQNSQRLQQLKLNTVYKINLSECDLNFVNLISKYSASLNCDADCSIKMLKMKLISKTLLSGTYKINILSHDLTSQGIFIASSDVLKNVKFYEI
jgi:hypothetical protein